MTDTNRIEVEFGARTSELDAAAQKAAKDVQGFQHGAQQGAAGLAGAWSKLGSVFSGVADASGQAAQSMKGHWDGVGSAFGAVQGKLLLLSGIVAGGAFFKSAIADTVKMTGEQLMLAKRLGITGTEASTLHTALGDIGSDAETYTGAFDKFARQIKSNEDGLQAMGLKTRDANGHLRDGNTLFTEALQVVGQYKPGIDQTTAAMTLFGKGVDDAMKLQKLNNKVLDDAKKKNEELGLGLTVEGVAATKAYKAAMNDVGDVLTAVMNTVGRAVMPVFTRLAEWFADIAPPAIFALRIAINALATAFQGVILVVKIVWDVLKALFDPLFTFGSALRKLLSGDINGATAEMMKLGANWGKAMSGVFDQIADDSKRTWTEVQNLWGKGTEVAAPKSNGNRTMGNMGPEKSRMADWEAELAARKQAIAEEARVDGTFRQMSLEDEAAYWQKLLQRQDLGQKERVALRKKAAEASLAVDLQEFETRIEGLKVERDAMEKNYAERIKISQQAYDEIAGKYGAESKEAKAAFGEILAERRKLEEQTRQLAQLRLDAEQKASLAGVEMERMAAQSQYDFRAISKAEQLELERQFEEQAYAIKRQYLDARLALIDPDRDPVAYAQTNEQLEELARQHALQMAQIQMQAIAEARAPTMQIANSLEQGFAGVFARIGTSIRSIGDLMRGLGQVILQSFIQVLAQMAAKWLVNKLLMMAIGKTTALGEISAEAGKAGAAGVASWAEAPWPINMGAPAFGAAMATAAMGFAGMASAAGGYDIPAGVDPLVQAHAKEMILPAHIADPLRESLSGDSGSGGSSVPLNVVPVGNFFMVVQNELIEALDKLHRNRALPFEGRK